MIVVDYIQLMKGTTYNKDGRVQEISQITQGLKSYCKRIWSSCCSVISIIKTSRTTR